MGHRMEPGSTWIGDFPEQPYIWPNPPPVYTPPPFTGTFPHHGCICPPTSEQTCQGDYCPRRPAKPWSSLC